MLKPSQQLIFDEVIAAIKSGEKRLILKGSAGTGKTYLTTVLVEYFASKIGRWDESKVYVTAPTNKALSILQGKMGEMKGVKFVTTHSALKLYRYVHPKTGVVSFKPNKKGEPPFFKATIAIVDECSMLNTELIKYLDEFSFPIIFVGDDKQINPVGEVGVPIFNRTYPVFELTEIIRQGAGNPIIDLSRDLDKIWFKVPTLIEGKGYMYNNDRNQIIQNLAEVNGTDDLKYLSYTNLDVDTINKEVRQRIYNNPKRIEISESLIFKEPYRDYWTNQEIKVQNLDIVEAEFNFPDEHTRFANDGSWIKPQVKKFKTYVINNNIHVISEESDEDYNEIKRHILTKCKSENWDWRGYFFFLEQFGNLTYNHAITVHKS